MSHQDMLQIFEVERFLIDHVIPRDREALRLSAISFDAVKMLLLARLENRPARLDLTFYPYLL
jgi:hypothetical protein